MTRPLVERILGRLLPNSEFGPSWYRMGDYVTFKTRGFAHAPNLPRMCARIYYERQCIGEALSRIPAGGGPTKSLEIGCGYGRLSPHIADHVDEHIAVDVNPEALAEARHVLPHLKFLEASVTELPFDDDTFDALVSWTVLQHVMPDLIGTAIAELNRVLKDSAILVLCEATLHGDNPQQPGSHTHDRPPEFYANGFPGRPLIVSRFIEEIDRIDGMDSPGRLMVLGPRE